MNISATGYNSGVYNTATAKAVKTAEQPKAKEEMSLEEYKAHFDKKADALYLHPSQRNYNPIIVITDAAYERMRVDDEYEDKVLNALATNRAVNFGNNIPEYSYLCIDDTWEKSYGYTVGMKENLPSSKNASSEKVKKLFDKDPMKKLLEDRMFYQKMLERNKEIRERNEESYNRLLETRQLSRKEMAILQYDRNTLYAD